CADPVMSHCEYSIGVHTCSMNMLLPDFGRMVNRYVLVTCAEAPVDVLEIEEEVFIPAPCFAIGYPVKKHAGTGYPAHLSGAAAHCQGNLPRPGAFEPQSVLQFPAFEFCPESG